jgi:cellulose synthase operon protein C
MCRFRPGELFELYVHAVRGLPFRLAFCVILLLMPYTAFSQVEHIQSAARFLDEGQPEKAEREAQQALSDPRTRPLALSMLGTIRLQQNKYEESERFLRQALRLNPGLVGARLTLGDAYLLQNRLAEARTNFQEALTRDPSNFDARFHLAKVESSLSNFQRSLDLAKPIEPKLRGSDDGILLFATDYAGLGKRQELNALCEDWQRLPERSPEVALDFGLVLANFGLLDKAKPMFDEVDSASAVQSSAPILLKLAQAYFSVNSVDRAEKDFTLALSLDSGCVACNLGLAQIAEKQGNPEKALAYLIQAKKTDPENPTIVFEFGKVCLEQDLLKDAMPALKKAVELQPDREDYVYELASADVGQGNLTDAESLLTRLLRKHPQDPGIIYAMGAVYYLEGKFADAKSFLKHSLEIRADQIGASYYLGLTYDTSGDDEQAVVVFQDLLKRHPDYGLGYVKLGTILLREHKYEEARQNLEKAIALLPASGEAHYQLAVLFKRTGNTAESENQFAEARKLESERTQVRFQLLLPN